MFLHSGPSKSEKGDYVECRTVNKINVQISECREYIHNYFLLLKIINSISKTLIVSHMDKNLSKRDGAMIHDYFD